MNKRCRGDVDKDPQYRSISQGLIMASAREAEDLGDWHNLSGRSKQEQTMQMSK